MMEHRDILDLLPGYVLGALDVHEREDVFEHLQTCSTCSPVAEQHLDVARVLSSGITAVEPPPGLMGRIEASIAQLSAPLVAPAAPEAPPVPTAPPSPVAPPPPRRPWFSAPWAGWATAGVGTVTIGLLAAVLVYAVASQGDLSDLQADNQALSSKVDGQTAGLATSQQALDQLGIANQALTAKLDSQAAALSASQEELSGLRKENQALATALDAQDDVLDSTLAELAQLRQGTQSLSTALATSQADLTELRRDTESVSSALAASQTDLSGIRDDNEALAGAVAASQGDLTELRAANAALAKSLDAQGSTLASTQEELLALRVATTELDANVNTQRIFTYLQELPAQRKYVLKATADAPGTFGMVVANVANVWGIAILLGVDALETGMAYQIWLEKADG